jgi:hypothetical protein
MLNYQRVNRDPPPNPWHFWLNARPLFLVQPSPNRYGSHWSRTTDVVHLFGYPDDLSTGWWCTPLKNDGVRQLAWWISQYIMETYKMFQTTDQNMFSKRFCKGFRSTVFDRDTLCWCRKPPPVLLKSSGLKISCSHGFLWHFCRRWIIWRYPKFHIVYIILYPIVSPYNIFW